MKIIVTGQMAGGSRILRAVIASGHEVVAVMTPPSESKRFGNMVEIAEKNGIPVLPGMRLKEPWFARTMDCDILLSVLSPFHICDEALSAPRIGAFNLHPSALPRYGGLTPTSFAILHGAREHGVTLHWMASDIDAGPIVSQALFPITDNDTPVTLLRHAFTVGTPLVTELLDLAGRNPIAIPRIAQNVTQRQYHSKSDYPSTELYWEDPAPYLHALVRACDYGPSPCPWGEVTATLGDSRVRILTMERTGEYSFGTLAGSTEKMTRGIRVAAAGEWLLVTKYEHRENNEGLFIDPETSVGDLRTRLML